MIEQATERRLAGDWRGACAVANVDVRFDLAEVANEHGAAVAAEIEDDLRHFAPDLLRWHLPRLDNGMTMVPDRVILGRPGGGGPNAPYLYLGRSRRRPVGTHRLRLDVGSFRNHGVRLDRQSRRNVTPVWHNITHEWGTSRYLWDARHADESRERCGGDKDRIPFFHGDGSPRTAAELPTADPGRADPVAFAEWVTLLHERGEVEAAFAAVAIELDTTPVEFRDHSVDPLDVFEEIPFASTQLEAEFRRLAVAVRTSSFWVIHHLSLVCFETSGPGAGLRARMVKFERGEDLAGVVLPEACWRRLPDLDLLRDGFPPEHLHPLVRNALFPDRTEAGGPVGPPEVELPAPVRVYCRSEWHEVSFRAGVLQVPHSAEEQRRESALRVFGGEITGCFAVQDAWTSGYGRLPKALDQHREELFDLTEYGDLSGVLRLLDAGVDPRVRDSDQHTLLHTLYWFDSGADLRVSGPPRRDSADALLPPDLDGLLERLLAAGLDIDSRGTHGRTPLYAAILNNASTALVRALLAAGARIDVTADNPSGWSLHTLIHRLEREDLYFLAERIEREHPELVHEWDRPKPPIMGKGENE